MGKIASFRVGKRGMGMIIRFMIMVIIRMAMVTPTFRVDRKGEAPKLRRSSTISTRPAAAAS